MTTTTIETLDSIVNFVPRIGAGIGESLAGQPGKYIGAGVGYLFEIGVVGAIVPFVGGIAAMALGLASPIAYVLNKKSE